MYPSTQQPSPASTPSTTPADLRVEAFCEFLAAIDRTESVLASMRRLRRLGFSVCVVKPQPARSPASPEGGSVHDGPNEDGVMQTSSLDRPPLLSLDVTGQPAPCQSWGDENDHVVAQMRRHALDDWMTAVARSALAAIRHRDLPRPGSPFPHTGPVHVDLTFVSEAQPDAATGSPWACAVKRNGTKADPSVPDLDRLARATLEALAGIAMADVSQVSSIAARKVYGPSSGASITIYTACFATAVESITNTHRQTR